MLQIPHVVRKTDKLEIYLQILVISREIKQQPILEHFQGHNGNLTGKRLGLVRQRIYQYRFRYYSDDSHGHKRSHMQAKPCNKDHDAGAI